METNTTNGESQLIDLVRKWKISQAMLAQKIGMPYSSFKNKFNPNMPGQRFTTEELTKIEGVLDSMAKAFLKKRKTNHPLLDGLL